MEILLTNIAMLVGMGINYKQILDMRLVRIVNLHLCTTNDTFFDTSIENISENLMFFL